MVCSILLLIILTSCVSGTFVVNVTQTSYQAEENQDITLEWTFTTNPHTSSTSLNVFCELITDLKDQVLFHLHEGVEVPESQDKQFAGRVQWDKDVLREGRLRLHVSRLRTEDSGMYLCDVLTNYGTNSRRCWLNVTAAADEPKPQRPTVGPEPEPESLGNIWILRAGQAAAVVTVVTLAAAAAVVVTVTAVLLILSLCFKSINNIFTDNKGNYLPFPAVSFSEKRVNRTNSTQSEGPSFNKSSKHRTALPRVHQQQQTVCFAPDQS